MRQLEVLTKQLPQADRQSRSILVPKPKQLPVNLLAKMQNLCLIEAAANKWDGLIEQLVESLALQKTMEAVGI